MELNKFITNTLLSITNGVECANKINNRFQLSGKTHSVKNVSGEYVEFDIVIEVNSSTKGEIGVSAIGIGGGGVESIKNNQNTNRLKFTVFVTEKTV